MTFRATFFKASLLIGLITPFSAVHALQRPFDYYVMSLSWSPEFCATRPADRQCGRGYGFVLHGLWPQYSKGYPSSCSSERLDNRLVRNHAGLYPSEKLAFHEWQKHGTCSGLSPENYLQLSESLKQGFVTPPALQNLSQPLRISATALKAAIVAANPTLNEAAVALNCKDGGRFLQEVYICYDELGSSPTACGSDVNRRSLKSCGQTDFLVRSIR